MIRVWSSLGTTFILNFQGQIFSLLYDPSQNGPIATKQNAKISIEHQASDVAISFDLSHDINLGLFKVKCLICYIQGRNGPIAT